VLHFEMHKLNTVHESFSYLHNNSYTLNLDHRSTHRVNKLNQVQWFKIRLIRTQESFMESQCIYLTQF